MKIIQENDSTEDFIPMEHFKGIDGTENVAHASGVMVYLKDVIREDILSVIEGIYGNTENVAEISRTPNIQTIDGDVTEIMNKIEQLVGITIPVSKIDDDKNTIVTKSNYIADSLGMKILKIINEGGTKEEVNKIYEAYEFFTGWSSTNNSQFEFISPKQGGNIEDFAKIKKVRI